MSGQTLCDPMDCSLPASSVHGILQEYWSGLPFTSPRDLPNPGIKPWSPALQAGSLPSKPPGNKALYCCYSKEELERGLIFKTYVDTSKNRNEQLSKVTQFQGRATLTEPHRLHTLSLTAFSLFTAHGLHFPLLLPPNQAIMLTHNFYSLPAWAGLWYPSCSHPSVNHAFQLWSHSSAQVLCCVIWVRTLPVLSISSDWGKCGHTGLQNTASSGRDLGNWLLSEKGFWWNMHS